MSTSDNGTAGMLVPVTSGEPANSSPQTHTPPQAVEFEIHESALIFPSMREAEFEMLVEDIRVNGQKEPIVVHAGKVIDGRHRFLACKRLGIAPLVREWDGKGSLLGFVVSTNLIRRHLKENQRAMIAARLLPHFEAEANARQGKKAAANIRTNSSECGRSKDFAGDLFCVSATSICCARKIINFGVPALIAKVDQGTLAVSLAAKIAEFPTAKQEHLVALPHGELLKSVRPGKGHTPPVDPNQKERDEKFCNIFFTTTVGLKRTNDGELRLELSMANWFNELKGFATNPHFVDLLDRGFYIARR